MQKEQTKPLLVNIMTGVIVVGILAAGYFAFTNRDQTQPTATPTSTPTSVSEIASRTALVGIEIEATVKDLSDLNHAVASSAIIFSTPAFQNLQDFSVGVASESVGRPNPFVWSDWKVSLKILENKAVNSTEVSAPTQGVSASPQTENVACRGRSDKENDGQGHLVLLQPPILG